MKKLAFIFFGTASSPLRSLRLTGLSTVGQRMNTFYVYRDFGDTEVNGQNDDWGVDWNFQTNSRLAQRQGR